MSALNDPGVMDTLRRLVAEHGIVNLVETGTGPSSSGLQAAAELGLRGYSCDVFAPCVNDARGRFPHWAENIFHANSMDFLREVLPYIGEPTFFWLDGHCPTDPECIDGPDFPPFEELQLIKALKHNYRCDVMWLDDMSMVTAPDNPIGVPWDVSLAGRPWHGNAEHSWAEYLALLSDTHTAEVVGSVLRYTPRW